MAESGCVGILVGLESLNKNSLTKMGKLTNCYLDYTSCLRKIREYGIAIYGTFMFGYDGDSVESLSGALEFALRERFFFAAFNHLVPFPGTPLYQQLRRENKLLYEKWWLNSHCYFGEVVFKPSQFSPQELRDKCLEYRQNFYTISSIIKRGLDFKVNCKNLFMGGVFFLYNLISRKEVKERFGLPLGEGLDSLER